MSHVWKIPPSAYTGVQFVVILFNFALTGWSLAKLSLTDALCECSRDRVLRRYLDNGETQLGIFSVSFDRRKVHAN